VVNNRTAQIAGLLLVVASGVMFFRGESEGDLGAHSSGDNITAGAITLRLVSGEDETQGLDCGASLWMVASDDARSLTSDPNRTCVDGHLLWEGLVPGDYRVMTRADGFLDGDIAATVEGALVDLGSTPLSYAASLEGVVTDAEGTVADARVLLSDGQATNTSSDGAFSFRNVPVGEIELRSASLGTRAQKIFELPIEGITDLTVELVDAAERGLLGLRCDLAECGCEISDLLPGSPAAAALSVGDCFSAVNGESIMGEPRNVIGSRLAGEVGEIITLTISGEPVELVLGAPVTFRPSR